MPGLGGYGVEWIVDAKGCRPADLRDPRALRHIFETLIHDLDLHPIGRPVWHRFPGPGGITGFWMLSESHLACHTFPEYGALCLNLYCCRPRRPWPWLDRLGKLVGAREVSVCPVRRNYGIAGKERA